MPVATSMSMARTTIGADGEAVMFDETYIHYAENATEQNRIILFCDVERPMKYRWAAAFNTWFSRNVMAAAGAPNEAGDKTGGINRLFGRIYKIRLRGKELKSATAHAITWKSGPSLAGCWPSSSSSDAFAWPTRASRTCLR
jgi:aspartyl/asparaginyl beta-hydroxylase (cupin superfamily)